MVTSTVILNKMNKKELRLVIAQYEKLTDNLRYQILLLKYQGFLEISTLQMKIPIQEILKEVDIELEQDNTTDIIDPNFNKFRKGESVAYQ
jgi:hypothetical protein